MRAPGPRVSLLEQLRIRTHLASCAEQARYREALWAGAGPSPATHLAASALLGGTALAGIVLGAWLLLPAAGIALNGFQAFIARDRTPGTPTRIPARASMSSQPSPSSARRPGPQHLFMPSTNAALQKRHDLWQDQYGDEIYRTELKPRAVKLALWQYLGDVLGVETTRPPKSWARAMSSDALEGYTFEAEREFRDEAKAP